jgi:hypothetical protein
MRDMHAAVARPGSACRVDERMEEGSKVSRLKVNATLSERLRSHARELTLARSSYRPGLDSLET